MRWSNSSWQRLYVLACSAKLPTGLYILPSVSFFFLNWSRLSQDLLDRFSRFFSPNGRYLRECCQSGQFFQFRWNEIHHRLADTRINSSTNCSTSREKMVKIGPVVFELKWGRKWKLCCDSAEIWGFSFSWHTGVLKRIGISQFWF